MRIKRFRNAQSTVELLLVFPVFLLIVCFIMEIGLLAYQTILAHHGAYEILRIGSLVAGPPGGTKYPHQKVKINKSKMEEVLGKFFRMGGARIVNVDFETTGTDPQTNYTHQHRDLVLELHYTARLFFPGSGYLLSEPKGSGKRTIKVKMRMPIEVPVFN